MADSFCLAVDAMGGDFGPRLVIPAALKTLSCHPRLRISVFGDRAQIEPFLADAPAAVKDRLNQIHCEQQVAMDEKPSSALRSKRNSSLWHALQAVAQGDADACVSAGNTGALMAMGMTVLETLPGIDRPAICTALPTLKGQSYLLDMGANLECSAGHLHQFALMASLMVSAVDQKPSPKVALLNIGSEASKGSEEIRSAAELLNADPRINYCGYVEGDGIFTGDCDIIVCDGFAGNIALKTSEGVARMIGSLLRENLCKNPWRKLVAWLNGPALHSLQKRMDPSLYNGASLLGLKGVVVKSHGSANLAGLMQAFDVARVEARQNVPNIISNSLAG